MPTRRRGQLILVTAQFLRGNPDFAEFLSDKIGHYVTAINGTGRATMHHYPDHCPTCPR